MDAGDNSDTGCELFDGRKTPEISHLSEDGTSHEGADTGNGAQGARHGASGNGVGGDKEKVLPANRRLLY